MASIITRQQRVHNSKIIRRLLDRTADQYYFVVGKNTEWDSEESPDTPVDSVKDEHELRDELLFFKRLTKDKTHTVTRRIDWDESVTPSTVYDQYDDTLDMSQLNWYVMTRDFNVYKCISNNNGAVSSTEPTGTSTSIITTADGYQWKYMFTLNGSEVFTYLTDLHMPVKTLSSDDGSDQWDVQQAATDGGLYHAVVTEGGSGYTMSPPPEVVITSSTGTGAEAEVVLNGDEIESIIFTDAGSGYKDATIAIDPPISGTQATARAVLSPIGGHGADPLIELGDGGLMFQLTFDGDEEGDFPLTEEYRQIAVIRNPITTTLGTVINTSGSDETSYARGEGVTGLSSSATATVHLWDEENGLLWLTDVTGTFLPSETIEGDDSEAVRTASSISSDYLPAVDDSYAATDIDVWSGDLLYMENRVVIERTSESDEEFRFVLQF